MKIRTTRRKAAHRARYALAAIAAAAALLPAACGGSSGGSAAGSPGNMSWFFWAGSPGDESVWQHNASLVSKTYPNLSVSLNTTSWTNYWTKLPLEASTHSMPCIAGLQYGYVGSVGNLFIPLNSLIKKHHYSLAPFEPTMIRELSANGNLLALPYDFGPVVITYNKALFQAKGVPYPQHGWTWSQFVQDAQRLTGGGDYGYLPVTLGGNALSLELAYDLTGVPNAYIQSGKFNPTNPAFEQGIQRQAELDYKYHVTPPYSTAPNWSAQEFESGKVGMQANGPWDLISLKEQANFPVGWVELPAGPRGVRTYNEGSGFGITKDCKTPDAAFKALTVLVSSQALSYAGSQGRAFPARLADDPSWSQFAGGNAGAVMETALKQAQPQQVTTNWTQFQTALGKYTPLVLSGKISAAQFASQVQAASGSGKGVAPGDLSSLLPNG
jgi:multiple sugar transport system substrate-binding protein